MNKIFPRIDEADGRKIPLEVRNALKRNSKESSLLPTGAKAYYLDGAFFVSGYTIDGSDVMQYLNKATLKQLNKGV